MGVLPVDQISAPALTPARTRTAARTSAETGHDRRSLDASRLAVITQLIESLTGRKVSLVPPHAYLVSAPSPPPVRQPEVELVVDDATVERHRSETGTLTVDITSVLRGGTSGRMILSTDREGAAVLYKAVDVEL